MMSLIEDDRRAGIVYGVLRDGQLGALEALGLADRTVPVPMATDSIFRIYSMSRAVTSVLILAMIDAGMLSLDDQVGAYLPAFTTMTAVDPADVTEQGRVPISPAMTIRHLLTYTGGITYLDAPTGLSLALPDIINQNHTLAEGIDLLAECPVPTQPGQKWRYGLSSDVLGRIAEVVTQEPLDVILKRVVLDPLGMGDTSFWAGPDHQRRLVRGYGPGVDGPLTDISDRMAPLYGTYTVPPRFQSAGGGLCSTVPDYLRFCQYLLDGITIDGSAIMSGVSRQAMLTSQVSAAQGLVFWYGQDPSSYVRDMEWGYGIGVVGDAAAKTIPYRGGAAAWYGLMNTFFFVDRAAGIAAVAMSQYLGPDEFSVGNLFREGVYAALDG
jgi:CubicO group peptidase (beta-lactamase class C family)